MIETHGIRLILVLAIAIVLAPVTDIVFAQGYPSKPVRFVFGPTPDLLPRLAGQKLTEVWDRQG